ncbi:MAG: DUF87 domain-containing protein [Bacilli bacterium]|nr:DUF87 domain-containing protein [Bacilli bacterium]
MNCTTEIFFAQKNIKQENWNQLIHTISNYCGYFHKWKLIITINHNQLQFFIKSRYDFPPTLNNLDCFFFKKAEDIKLPKIRNMGIIIPKLEDNVLHMIEKYEVKKKSQLQSIEIIFRKLAEDKILSKINIYSQKNTKITKKRLVLKVASAFLTVDFSSNKRYKYKGVPKYMDINKNLELLTMDKKQSLLKINPYPYFKEESYLNIFSYDFAKHSIIFGASGSGKSKFISSFIYSIFQNEEAKEKYKIILIDPHASLEKDIGEFASVKDFQRKESSMNLFFNLTNDVIAATENLLDLFKSLIANQYNAKLERMLRHCLLALMLSRSFNFNNLRRLLLETEYRNTLLKEERNKLPSSTISFFLTDFNDLKTRAYTETIAPLIAFIDELEMLPVFKDFSPKETLYDCLQNNFLTIFSLDRAKLGNKITKTISGLIMQQMMLLIEQFNFKEHIIFIIDEVAVIENPILCSFLAEARKYNLSLFVAGQYFNQITPQLKNAIFANVLNYYIFRVSRLDASVLVDNLEIKIPTNDTKEEKVKILSELPSRHMVLRVTKKGKLYPTMKGETLDYKSRPYIRPEDSVIIEKKNNQIPLTSVFVNDFTGTLKDILKSNSTSRKVIKDE